jgi:hypothetical protein
MDNGPVETIGLLRLFPNLFPLLCIEDSNVSLAFDLDTSGALWCRGADGVHNSWVYVPIASLPTQSERLEIEFHAGLTFPLQGW